MAASGALPLSNEESEELARRLMRFLPYLRLLARMQIENRFHPQLDSSWLAQQTIVRAYEKWHLFQGGDNDAQLAGWLRAILSNNIKDEWAKILRIPPTISLDDDVEKSSIALKEFLADEGLSPSDQADIKEQLLCLAEALEQLREEYRQAIEWRHLHGMKIVEVAQRMGKSTGQIANYLRQGLKELKQRMNQTH